ncbi:hypothetical protein Scep_026676 [Stephania cephalantha]|uniref:Protein kinase domain-containing protein n=1 Tax=Stephania cephalantha TaxID=152367 RepID=A0AAP0EQY5_9MAGN
MGAITAELFTSTPLFQGETDIDQIWKICSVIGTPTKETWEDGLQLGKEIRTFEFPKVYEGVDELAKLVPNADEDAMSLIRWLCSWDHWKRPTATEVLQHPFFASHYPVPKSIATCSPKLKAPSPAKRRKLDVHRAEHEMLEELGHHLYGKVITYYELVEGPGKGSFGSVWKAVDKHSSDKVAIKELKEFNGSSWKDILNLREVKALRGLDHPNIVKLEQLIMENNKLYLVMECIVKLEQLIMENNKLYLVMECIVKLEQLIMENNKLYLVMECMDTRT